jgi:hypothetical protein
MAANFRISWLGRNVRNGDWLPEREPNLRFGRDADLFAFRCNLNSSSRSAADTHSNCSALATAEDAADYAADDRTDPDFLG